MTGPRRIVRRFRAHAFVLLEVLVSLAILGIALSMVMKSLTTSLKAAKWSQQITTATVLARGLIEGWEIEPPVPGDLSSTFAPDHPRYSYEATYWPEEISYADRSDLADLDPVSPLRRVSVRVYFGSDESKRGKRQEVLRFETALIESEVFDVDSKLRNGLPFE
ncbi:type II secretion system protein [Candidatus Sumerlaeota bacterium]|nr:type II secretion system protein [Candidatus Sumerlaeota bacterium]